MPKLQTDSALARFLKRTDLFQKLGRVTKFFQRTPRKIFPEFLLHAVLISVADGIPHFRGIAERISSLGEASPSRQAVFARLKSERAPAFFQAVLKSLIDEQFFQRFAPTRIATGLSNTFERVIIEDGSVLPLHESLSETYEGSSNQHGTVAALRLRWAFDLLTGKTIDADLLPWRNNDMSTAYDILDDLKSGDLILRDMGYFCLECFHRITEIGAFYITRIPAGTAISFLDDSKEGLITRLRKAKQKGDLLIEAQVKVGKENAVTDRLIALKIDPSKASERRRKLRAESKRKGKIPSAAELEKCEWIIVLTNVPVEILEAKKVADLYRVRWMVEIFFKGLKSGQSLEKWSRHRTNENTIQCLAYGHMILGVLSLNLWRRMGVLLAQQTPEACKQNGIEKKNSTPETAQTIGPIKALETLIPFIIDIIRGTLKGESITRELIRRARYAAQEKRTRVSLDQMLADF